MFRLQHRCMSVHISLIIFRAVVALYLTFRFIKIINKRLQKIVLLIVWVSLFLDNRAFIIHI
jgi:hypothetical protein